MDAGKAAKLRQIIERAKRDLVNRYDLIHSAMRGEFMSAIYSPRVPSARAQRDIDRRLSTLGGEAARTEREISRSVTEEIHAVVGWVETPETVSNLFIFQADIVRQIRRDAKTVSSLFRQIQTTINTLTKDKYVSAKAQALQHITKPGVFTYKDKIGKIWDARTYLKTHGSKYYYGLANDLVVGDMRGKGLVNAVLDRPGHVSNGMVVSLSELGSEMQSKYFHPGSQGILT